MTSASLAADTRCLQCGYNLRGLTLDGRCPECGNVIRTSLELSLQLRRWLRDCTIGALLLALAPLIWVADWYVVANGSWTDPFGMLPTVCSIWIGCRLIASRSFPWHEASRVRAWLRTCAVVVVILMLAIRLVQQVAKEIEFPDFDDFLLILFWLDLFNLLGLAGSALLYVHLCSVAARLRMSALRWHARVMLLLLIIPAFMIARYTWGYLMRDVIYVFPFWLPGIGWSEMALWYIDEIVDDFRPELLRIPIWSLLVTAVFYLWPIWNTVLMVHVAIAAALARRRIVVR